MARDAALRWALVFALAAAPPGCAAWSGARLYAAGTHALDDGDTGMAITDLEEAGRLLPDSSEVQNHLGIAYEAAGRIDAAHAAYQRAVALDCSNEAAAHNLRAFEGRNRPASSVSVGASAP